VLWGILAWKGNGWTCKCASLEHDYIVTMDSQLNHLLLLRTHINYSL